MPSTSTPASGRRATITKRKAALKKPMTQNRLAVQAYMRSWEVAEDEALLAAIETHGARWRLVASDVPGRTEAMCRNRYQRIMAPIKEGKDCSSRNRCTRCGMMKRGHTCRGQAYVEMETLPSPLVIDSLGLKGDIELPLCLPAPAASPLPLSAETNPGRVTMAMAAGALEAGCGADGGGGGGVAEGVQMLGGVSGMEVVEELDDASEYAETTPPPPSECAEDFDPYERPLSAVALVTTSSANSSDSAPPDAEPTHAKGRTALLPTPVKKSTFAFKFHVAAPPPGAAQRPDAPPTALSELPMGLGGEEQLCDAEVAAALALDGAPPLDAAAIETALANLEGGLGDAPPATDDAAVTDKASDERGPPPALLSAPSLTVGPSFITGLLSGPSFEGAPAGGGGTPTVAPVPSRQMSDTLFLRDLMAQRAGGSPPPSLPTLDDPSPPSFSRFVSLGTLGF